MADVLVTVTGARGPRGLSGPSLTDLAASGGAALIGKAGGGTVQDAITAGSTGVYGATNTRSINTNLNGSLVAANLGQIYIGNNVASADAITIDSSGAWPGGVAFRRFLGTPSSPTIVTAGTQLGYCDYRGYSGAVFFNAGSFDCIVDSGIDFDPGEIMPTKFRWLLNANNAVSAYMELRAAGALEIGAHYPTEQQYAAPWGNGHKLLVHQRGNDYTASFVSNPAAGAGVNVRLHTMGETSSDSLLYMTSGAGSGSIKFNFTGQGRLGVGTGSPVCAIDANGPVKVGNYTVGTVPSAAAGAGQTIFVSNEVGGATLAFSDGTAWRRVADRTVVA